MKLVAKNVKVHVKPIDEVRSSILHMPASAKQHPTRGTVVSVGERVPTDLGIAPGAVVLLQKLEGDYVSIGDQEPVIALDYKHILGVEE